jgi:hypothetical protein
VRRLKGAFAAGLVGLVAACGAPGAPLVGASTAAVRPVILWYRVSRHSLPYTGGSVSFTVRVQHTNGCRLVVAGSSAVSVSNSKSWERCSNGILREPVTFGTNAGRAARWLAFRAYFRRGSKTYWTSLGSIRVNGAPTTSSSPVSTSVALSLTSSATDGETTSKLVDFTATPSATCRYADGSSRPCPVPSGTVSWILDGANLGGNLTRQSSPLSSCRATVGGAIARYTCRVTFGTYGDQWVSALYASATGAMVTRTLEVQLVAPVDMGAGHAYSAYDNVGSGALEDCTMAAAADWIETAFGTVPSDQETIDAYWQAEAEYNGGRDVGLAVTEFFSFWQNKGTDGTLLTGTTPLDSDAAIETYLSKNLSGGDALIADASLPNGFPPGQTGAGHQWIIVGYSSYGPMIVTWGQEIQISWARFDSMTWSGEGDVFSITVSN